MTKVFQQGRDAEARLCAGSHRVPGRGTTRTLAFAAALLLAVRTAVPAVPWHSNANPAFKEAKVAGKPVVIFARTDWDRGSQWIETHVLTRADVQAELGHYARAQVWVGAKVLRELGLTQVGFLLFTADRDLLSRVQPHEPVARLVDELRAARGRVGRVQQLAAALEKEPKNDAALTELIDELTRRRKFKQAAEQFGRLAELRPLTEPEQARQCEAEARRALADKKHSDAAARAESFVGRYPTHERVAEVALLGARAYGKQRHYDQAIRLVEQAIERCPDPADAPRLALRLAELQAAVEATDAAEKTRTMILERWPRSAAAVQAGLRKANALWLEAGQPDAARRCLDRIMSLEPEPSPAIVGPGPWVEQARVQAKLIACEPRWIAAGRTVPRAAGLVVLVPDLPTFLHAVSQWDRDLCFPVLFDDPKWARKFIAAYGPAQIVYATKRSPQEVTPELLQRAAMAAMGPGAIADDLDARPDAFRRAWAGLPGAPAGAVVTSLAADGLPAAVALAAARRQALLLADAAPKAQGSTVSTQDADALRAWLVQELDRWKLPHQRLGDGMDFVTLALPWPSRYRETRGVFPGVRALDDALTRREDRTRFAFCGRILGDRAMATYAAMCALFLRPSRALLFNTYGSRAGSIWASYGMAQAETVLGKDMEVTHVVGRPGDLTEWHRLVMPRNAFGLVAVNSSGGRTNWSIAGGGGTTEDVPDTAPCMVHFTHSGSATAPTDADSIAGRWLANGAYLYFGSLAEPYLTAFTPPSRFARRLDRGWPAGAAFRRMRGESFWTPWRLWLLGDPLSTLAGPERAPGPVPDVSGQSVAERLQALQGPAPLPNAQRACAAFVAGRYSEAAAAAACATDGLAEPLAAQVRYVRLAVEMSAGHTAKVVALGEAMPPERRGRAADLLWRTAAAAQLHQALQAKDADAALARLRRIAPRATTSRYLLRVVKALKPLCESDERQQALRTAADELKKLRPKDKKFHAGLDKALGQAKAQ